MACTRLSQNIASECAQAFVAVHVRREPFVWRVIGSTPAHEFGNASLFKIYHRASVSPAWRVAFAGVVRLQEMKCHAPSSRIWRVFHMLRLPRQRVQPLHDVQREIAQFT